MELNQSKLFIEISIRNLEEFWSLLYNSNSSNKTYKPKNLTHISVCIRCTIASPMKTRGGNYGSWFLRNYFVCINRFVSFLWHQSTKTTNLVFHNFSPEIFSVLAVKKENKLFIGPKLDKNLFWTNKKFVFFFNC